MEEEGDLDEATRRAELSKIGRINLTGRMPDVADEIHVRSLCPNFCSTG